MELVRLATEGENEATRIAAIKEVFDRAIGKAVEPVETEVQFAILHELQRILDAHDGQSRSIPLRTNALALVDLNGDGGDHGNGIKTGAAPGGLGVVKRLLDWAGGAAQWIALIGGFAASGAAF